VAIGADTNKNRQQNTTSVISWEQHYYYFVSPHSQSNKEISSIHEK